MVIQEPDTTHHGLDIIYLQVSTLIMSVETAVAARGSELNNIDKHPGRPLQPVGFPQINNREQYFIESRVSFQIWIEHSKIFIN